MKIRLVSHASVIVQCSDAVIWTDPWLISKTFNDSWTLLPAPNFSQSLLRDVGFIWLSHEHPDHLNFPTLASLPADFKSRVNILFQQNNPERIFEPLRKIGYKNFIVLPHRRFVPITDNTKVYCFRVGTIDSCLAVINAGQVVFNVNDARINSADCKTVLKELGRVDVVLNQFSLAVYTGYADRETYVKRAAVNVLESLSATQRDLRAPATIPFASLMYFSTTDNRFMNTYANKPRDVVEFCAANRQRVDVMYPGDEYEVGQNHYDSSAALAKYDHLYARSGGLPYDVPPVVSLAALQESLSALMVRMRERYPDVLLRMLKPLNIEIPDLGTTVELSLAKGHLKEMTSGAPDLIIHSQPLHYGLSYPWGLQTLSVSARFTILNNRQNWRWHKALFALHSADVYLKPTHLLHRRNRAFFFDLLGALRRYSDRSLAVTTENLHQAKIGLVRKPVTTNRDEPVYSAGQHESK